MMKHVAFEDTMGAYDTFAGASQQAPRSLLLQTGSANSLSGL